MAQLGIRMINIDFYPLLGGAQMHTLRLSRFLSRQGVDVQVITRHHTGLLHHETIDGIPVYRTPIWHSSKIIASLSFTFYALRELRSTRRQYQIVHSHEMLSPMTIGLLSRGLLGTRLVINPHGGGYMGDMYKLVNRRPFTGGIRLRWAGQQGDAFIAISREIASEMEAAGIPREKIHFIPCAIDTDHFYPVNDHDRAALRAQLGMEEGIWACFAGRLVAGKGVDVLLQAWAAITQHSPTVRLLIMGDGDQRSNLEALTSQLGLEQQVHFTGTVADTVQYLQACDIYVQPSFAEGLPIAVLEAMASGLPVIATAVGGVKDLLRNGQNGMVIPPHDVDSLREYLFDLITDKSLRASLGAQARQDVVAYCAVERVGQAHLDLYRQLVDRASQHSAPTPGA